VDAKKLDVSFLPDRKLAPETESSVEKTKTSQANPMTIWCLLVMALVTTVLAKERRTRRLEEMMVDDYRWGAIKPRARR
jgi:hypothetical protein